MFDKHSCINLMHIYGKSFARIGIISYIPIYP